MPHSHTSTSVLTGSWTLNTWMVTLLNNFLSKVLLVIDFDWGKADYSFYCQLSVCYANSILLEEKKCVCVCVCVCVGGGNCMNFVVYQIKFPNLYWLWEPFLLWCDSTEGINITGYGLRSQLASVNPVTNGSPCTGWFIITTSVYHLNHQHINVYQHRHFTQQLSYYCNYIYLL
jgi:hypothetical protein